MQEDPDGVVIAASLDVPTRFGEIFDRHFARIHGYLRRRAGLEIADEAASETFLIAFDRRGRFDTSCPDASPWLFGIATNVLHNHRRREARELRAYVRAGVEEAPGGLDGAEARLDAAAMADRLTEALLALRPEEADVLLLFAWGELAYGEIAESLGLPIGTVRSRLARARVHVRELLEADRTTTGYEEVGGSADG
ncbi:MAG TPA: RNA polymerase sigma factor [Solirubrobacterales bacterium]|nr:RNA polymerase sigma factor [Solirubrobacterales bacterium]